MNLFTNSIFQEFIEFRKSFLYSQMEFTLIGDLWREK